VVGVVAPSTIWAAVFAVYEDVFDLSRPYLTLRVTTEDMRPAIRSVWEDDYFAQVNAPTPRQLLFWNGNDPTACNPYIEQFERHLGCREVALDVDPFDVRWSTVPRVMALLKE
jgi:hypothetical protein